MGKGPLQSSWEREEEEEEEEEIREEWGASSNSSAGSCPVELGKVCKEREKSILAEVLEIPEAREEVWLLLLLLSGGAMLARGDARDACL